MISNPTQLSEIDAVDVVRLAGVKPDHVGNYMQEAVKAPYVRVTDELAQQIADLWRQLPAGAPRRCHTPPFGLRFYRRRILQLQASICWQCNNIFGDANGDRVSFNFDAHGKASKKLLSLCKKVFETG